MFGVFDKAGLVLIFTDWRILLGLPGDCSPQNIMIGAVPCPSPTAVLPHARVHIVGPLSEEIRREVGLVGRTDGWHAQNSLHCCHLAHQLRMLTAGFEEGRSELELKVLVELGKFGKLCVGGVVLSVVVLRAESCSSSPG